MSRTVIVAAALASKPQNGGNAWARLGFVLGLRRLGYEPVFVEQADAPTELACRFFAEVCRRFGIRGELLSGASARSELRERAEDAALLVNIGGNLTLPELKRGPRVKVYVDDDPSYTQYWHQAGLLGSRLAGHDFYFTYGRNIGRHGCSIPTGGFDWLPTLPPVFLDEWPVGEPVAGDRFTTVGTWRGAYGRLEADGQLLGQKAHEFRELAPLPTLAPGRFELALAFDAADAADADLLRRTGWDVVDPASVANGLDDYRTYLVGSGAELSAAQGAYVATRSGWFSDRTAHYLACGRPAVVQDTGFGPDLAGGEGVLPFASLDEAVRQVRRLAASYDEHAQAARELAVRHFASDIVLGRLLEAVGA